MLADWYGTEDALVYNSGYQANVGAITALLGAGDIAYPDSEAHASIHNGIRLSGASARSFAHNDIEALDACVDPHRGSDGNQAGRRRRPVFDAR